MRNERIRFGKGFRFQIAAYGAWSLLLALLTEGMGLLLLHQALLVSGASGGGIPYAGAAIPREAAREATEGFGGAAGYAAAPSLPWQAEAAWRSGASAQGAWEVRIGATVAFLVAVGAVLFFLYFLLFAQRIARKLEQIAACVDNMAEGDLSARADVKGEDEFAWIAGRLGEMSEEIGHLIESERKNEKMKDDLITNVAHDLRTPLTSVIGYLSLLVADPGMEEGMRRRYVEIAHDKSVRLQKLIEDLFSYTRISEEEIVAKREPLDVVRLVEQMMDEFYPIFQECGLAYEFRSSCESAMVMADGDLLARAFSNLIENAVKYGKDGKTVRVFLESDGEWVSVSIVNYGRIIPKKDIEHVFDRFYRVEESRSEDTGGTGLGLAIAKKVILLHDGEIRADSGMSGTTFQVRLRVWDGREEAHGQDGKG